MVVKRKHETQMMAWVSLFRGTAPLWLPAGKIAVNVWQGLARTTAEAGAAVPSIAQTTGKKQTR
jgi:hypothetical protein